MLHSTSEYLGHCESWHKHAACNAGLCGAPMCGNATQRDSHAGRLRAGQTSKRECAATGRPRRTGPYPCGSLLTVPVHEIRPCACPGLFRQHEICPCACPGLFRQHSLLDYQNQTLCSPPPPPQPLPPPLSQRLRELKPDALLVLGLPLSGTGISDSCGCPAGHVLRPQPAADCCTAGKGSNAQHCTALLQHTRSDAIAIIHLKSKGRQGGEGRREGGRRGLWRFACCHPAMRQTSL